MSAIYGFNHYYGSTGYSNDGSEVNGSNVTLDTDNFDKILSPTDNDIQKALETLDNHTHAASEITTDTSTWTGDILTNAETQVQAALNKLNSYLETNTSFINYAGLPDKYGHVRIGNNQTIAEYTGGICIGNGAEAGLGPEIAPAGYGSICIGNGIGPEFQHGPWSEGPNSICIGMASNSSFLGGIAIGLCASSYDGCVAVGAFSSQFNESGNCCTSVGYYSLQNNSAAYNTAIGYAALSEATTCTDDIAIGYLALMYASGANYNVAIGNEAMKGDNDFKVTGDLNVAIGYRALGRTTAVISGNRNVGIGPACLTSLTSGGDNVCIGYSAGAQINVGSNNICIGNIAKASAAINYGISIGYDSNVTGNDGIAIGKSSTAGANGIAIGSGVTAAANAAAIGNSSVTDVYLPNKVNGVGPEYLDGTATGTFSTITFKYPTVHKFTNLSTTYVNLGLNLSYSYMTQMALKVTNGSVGTFWIYVAYDSTVPKYVCTHAVGANVTITQTAAYPDAYFDITVGGDAATYTLHINTGSNALTQLKSSELRSGTTELKTIRYVM